MELRAKFLTSAEDLDAVVSAINSSQWDAANEMCEYSVDGLRCYLQQVDTHFVVCFAMSESGEIFAGIASGRILTKP